MTILNGTATEASKMEENEVYARYVLVPAPERTKPTADDDPRLAIYFCVDDVAIDPNKQRDVKNARVEGMTPWLWELAETPTITVRKDEVLAVTEGQNRVLRRQLDAPGSYMWGIISPSSRESAVAMGIARGRRPFSPYDYWHLRKADGDPKVLMGEAVMASMSPPLQLFDQAGKSGFGISAVTVVSRIMDTYESVTESAELLREILSVLTETWPNPKEDRRLDGRLLGALHHLIVRNGEFYEHKRMVDTLKLNGAHRWWQYGTERGYGDTSVSAVGKQVAKLYNRNKKTKKIEW